MRPQDIEKIANGVINTFGRPSAASAGCGSASNTQAFTCADSFDCATQYECGGAAAFTCAGAFSGDPECDNQFACYEGFSFRWECDNFRIASFDLIG